MMGDLLQVMCYPHQLQSRSQQGLLAHLPQRPSLRPPPPSGRPAPRPTSLSWESYRNPRRLVAPGTIREGFVQGVPEKVKSTDKICSFFEKGKEAHLRQAVIREEGAETQPWTSWVGHGQNQTRAHVEFPPLASAALGVLG